MTPQDTVAGLDCCKVAGRFTFRVSRAGNPVCRGGCRALPEPGDLLRARGPLTITLMPLLFR